MKTKAQINRERTFYKNALNEGSVTADLLNVALNLFNYHGDLKTLKAVDIEKHLMLHGNCTIFADKNNTLFCLPFVPVGRLDYNGNPVRWYAYDFNGVTYPLDVTNAVYIFNNRARTSAIPNIIKYAEIISEIDNVRRTNLNIQRTPYIIDCPESLTEKFDLLLSDLSCNTGKLLGRKKEILDSISVLNLEAPYLLDKLTEYRNTVLSEFYNSFGIVNNPFHKKERLITDEILTANASVSNTFNSFYAERVEGFERVRKMFGVEIVCEPVNINQKEGANNDKLV